MPTRRPADQPHDQDADLEAHGRASDRAAEGGQVRAVPDRVITDRVITDRVITDRVVTGVAFFFYVVVFASVAAMSYRGLMAFAADTLGLSGGWRYVVPVSLDGAAVSASFFGYRASIHGEPAFGPRLLVCLFGGASAFFNGHEAAAEQGRLAAAFYAGMSVLVVLMFDLGAKQIRRRALARQGKLEAPLPRFRLARWLLAPVETFSALRIAALESDLTADQAVHLARTRRTPSPTTATSSEPGAGEPAGSARPPAAAATDASTSVPTGSSHARRVDPGSAGRGGQDQGSGLATPRAVARLADPGSAGWAAGGAGDGEDGGPGVDSPGETGGGPGGGQATDERDAGHRDASPRGGTDARLTVLAMLEFAVSAGLPLTGREVSERVGCHVGEGRKLLREARLQHLQGRLVDAARRGAEVTTEDVVALYLVRVDHAGKLLSDARHGAAPRGGLPAAPADVPPQPDDDDGGTHRRLVAAS